MWLHDLSSNSCVISDNGKCEHTLSIDCRFRHAIFEILFDSSRSAHARRPSLFSPAKAAPSPNFRDAPMSLLQGADPFGGTQGGRGGARETKGTHRGPKGTQGRLRRPWGDGPMGPFGVIPKLFRMESHFEWSLNCAGKRTLISRWGQIVPTSRNGPKWSNMVSKLTIWSIWATMGPK